MNALQDGIITTNEWGENYVYRSARWEVGFRLEVNRHFGLQLNSRAECKDWYSQVHVKTPEWLAHAAAEEAAPRRRRGM